MCTASRGACIADPCRQTERCREKGYCTWLDGKCQAGSVEDCQQSQLCREDGKCMLNTKHHNCSDGSARRSTGAMIAGIVLVGTSGVAALAGAAFFIAAESYECDSLICLGPDADDYRVMGTAMLIGGGVTLSVGLPLLIYGAPKVVDEDAVTDQRAWLPEVRVGPTGGSFSWRF
jgi:hypothetical protein